MVEDFKSKAFFVAEEPRKFSFSRLADLFKSKENTPKVRWLAFSKKIADAFTRQEQKEIATQVDGFVVEAVELNEKSLNLNILFNVLFNMLGLPGLSIYYLLETIQKGGPEEIDLIVGPLLAFYAFYSFINSIKSNEYLQALKQKMIQEGLDELVVFVDMMLHRSGRTPKF